MERSIEDEFEELAAHHRLVTEFHNCASEWFNAIQSTSKPCVDSDGSGSRH